MDNKFEFNFNLEAWIDNVIIEDAKTVEEAKKKLLSMSLADLLAAGGYERGITEISDIECDKAEIEVKVENVKYGEGVEDAEEEFYLTVDVLGVDEDDYNEAIEDEIYDYQGYRPVSFDWHYV